MDRNWLRRRALESIYKAESGHPGGVLSCIDIIDYLFSNVLKFNVNELDSPNRDRFILSKGHSAAALYVVASKVGIIPVERLNGLRKIDHELQAHTHRGSTPWVEASTGSLGQGFSFAIGEAIGMKMQDVRQDVFVMLGDGELQEGEIWEGVMFASHHKLHNLCAIVDYNKLQSDDLNANIMGLEPLAEKWNSFGWRVIEIDGHDDSDIAKGFAFHKKNISSPSVIIAHTVKGKGVSFMENMPAWHGSVKISDEDLMAAMRELKAEPNEIEEILNG